MDLGLGRLQLSLLVLESSKARLLLLQVLQKLLLLACIILLNAGAHLGRGHALGRGRLAAGLGRAFLLNLCVAELKVSARMNK